MLPGREHQDTTCVPAAETAMSRHKQVIGNGLRAQTDERRATEVNVAFRVLNHMLGLGRPNSVRIV